MDMDTAVLVANAPVSYGAFERTIGMPGVPTGEDVLSAVAGAGYAGIDLGPVGFLGRAEELRAALVTHGLGLAGGYVELPFTDPASLRGAWDELDAVLDQFDAAASLRASHPPRPTLAYAPTPERVAHPGQAGRNRSLALDLRPAPRSLPGLPRRSTGASRAGIRRRSIRSSGPPSRPPTRSRRCST